MNKPARAFKFVALASVSILLLVILFEFQGSNLALSVGQPLPSGKAAPQLVSIVDVGVLHAPDGSLWCWGGTGPAKTGLVEEPTDAPQRIDSAADWRRVAASFSHALALKADGSLWGWGWTGYGVARRHMERSE